MRRLTILFLLLITFSAFGQAPGEDRAMGWIAAFNSGSFDTLEAFVQKNYTADALSRRTVDERRAVYEQLRSAHGKLEAVSVVTTPRGLQIDVKPERGERLTFRFQIDAAAQNRIAGIGIEAGGDGEPRTELPAVPVSKSSTKEQLATALDRYVRDLAARDAFAGTVLVAKNGEVWFENAYGLASRRWNVPNKTTTRHNAGSITKRMTRTAIAQLAQAGKLKVDAPIITYLPDYPNKEIASKVTIQHLSDHKSGLGDIFTERFWKSNTMALVKPRDFIEFFGNDPLHFEPGQGQRYSNYGYVVLGAIIEAVSGQDYFDYIRKNVFDAAEMKSSGFIDHRQLLADVAIGHTREKGEWLEHRPSLRSGIPAGMHFSPARDLFVFDRAMRAGKLLDETWTRWYFRGGPTTSSDNYAGGLPGSNAGVASDGTWTVVVMANIDPPAAERLAEEIYRALQ